MEKMRLQCLGAGQEVGRSCFVLETDQRVMLDCGLKIYQPGGKRDMFPEQYQGPLDGMILSHAHFDHSGFLPELFTHEKISWFGTPPTLDIVSLLWPDSMKIMGEESPYAEEDIVRAQRKFVPVQYGQKLHLGETAFSFHDAGHIAGAAMVEAEWKGRRFVYSGDFKLEETKMHKGAKPVKDVDVLMIESTYHSREHPPRKPLEKKLKKEMDGIIENGGNVLFPAFAVGRTQELIAIVRSLMEGVPIFVDGMGKDVSRLYIKHGKYIRDAEEFSDMAETVIFVQGEQDRRDATSMPSVIISTAGMLQGGPIFNYLLNARPGSKLFFTGYNVEGTNGWRMMNEGRVDVDGNLLEVGLPWEYYDFSAHAGRSDLFEFVKKAGPERIILNHGDRIPEFQNELQGLGYEVHAPKNGDVLEL
ncbi:MAG: MBL fold metallo-hydrolase [Candidatus Micrarchaeota archaeon]